MPTRRSEAPADPPRRVLSNWLILRFRLNPSPRGLNHTDHGLPAGVNVHVLDRDLLLAFAAVAIKRVEQHREGARELASLVQVFMPQAGRLECVRALRSYGRRAFTETYSRAA